MSGSDRPLDFLSGPDGSPDPWSGLASALQKFGKDIAEYIEHLRNMPPPDTTTPVATNFQPVTWTESQGYQPGIMGGTFYIKMPPTPAIVLPMIMLYMIKDPNNHPQTCVLSLSDQHYEATGFLAATDDRHQNAWCAPVSPLPAGAYLAVTGTSVAYDGTTVADHGVMITVQYYATGVMLTMNWDDGGPRGGDSYDNDFKDKVVNLWLPIIYKTGPIGDFAGIQVKLQNIGNVLAR